MPRGQTEGTPTPMAGHLSADVLITDLDRTFTDPDLRLDADALDALARMRRRGVRAVLATGRTRRALEREPVLATAFDAYVLEGGALWGTPGNWTLTAPDLAPLGRLAAALGSAGVEVDRGEASLSIAALDAGLLQAVDGAAEVSARRNRDRIDVTPLGVDKAVGVRRVLAHWGMDPTRAVAVGDGENDAELLVLVGHGVAVANAVPGLKAVAREVAPFPASRGFVWLAQRIHPVPGPADTPA